MTTRRRARSAAAVLQVTEGSRVPRSLLIGACVEVWADPAHPENVLTARSRFSQARRRWIGAAAPDASTRDLQELGLGHLGAPWLIDRDMNDARARLARAGARLSDLDQLRDEAAQLLLEIP